MLTERILLPKMTNSKRRMKAGVKYILMTTGWVGGGGKEVMVESVTQLLLQISPPPWLQMRIGLFQGTQVMLKDVRPIAISVFSQDTPWECDTLTGIISQEDPEPSSSRHGYTQKLGALTKGLRLCLGQTYPEVMVSQRENGTDLHMWTISLDFRNSQQYNSKVLLDPRSWE